jgi:hypothetical protein
MMDTGGNDMKSALIALVLLFALAAPACGCTGAAAMGMGYAYLAVADGPDAIYWAPDRLYAIEPGISFCLGSDGYKWTIQIITQNHLGVLIENHQPLGGTPDTICAALAVPFWHSDYWSFGGMLWVQPGCIAPIAVMPSLSYRNDAFCFTMRIDSALRAGAALSVNQSLISLELYLSPEYHPDQLSVRPANARIRLGYQHDFSPYIAARIGLEAEKYLSFPDVYHFHTLTAGISMGPVDFAVAHTTGYIDHHGAYKTTKFPSELEYRFSYTVNI